MVLRRVRKTRARASMATLALLLACGDSGKDEGKLPTDPPPHGGSAASDAGGVSGAGGMGGNSTGDAGGMGGAGGTGSGDAGPDTVDSGGGSGGASGDAGGCHPNPDTDNQVCTEVCPETCNNVDDDCDRHVDEDASNDCPLANATTACVSGECLLVACDTDFRDCDGEMETGCEISVIDDPDNCGGCGMVCELANTVVAACGGDFICEVDVCAPGWGNCDGKHDNGCEEAIGAGECGCGADDPDSDSDGTPDCADDCPNDPDKTTDGVCGCGVSEIDTDKDGTPDCDDDCPNDPDKTAEGTCGCSTPDDDSDTDGTLDCDDECPGDPADITAPCGPLRASNVDAGAFDFDSAPSVNVDCDVTFDTTALAPTDWCGVTVVPTVTAQTSGGTDVVIVPLAAFAVTATHTLTFVGTRPIVLLVDGDAVIDGTVGAGSSGASVQGAGGGLDCAPAPSGGEGSPGGDSTNGSEGAGGGGGGGFSDVGGNGGMGAGGAVGTGGGGGAAGGVAELVPLRGGCAGGRGGDGKPDPSTLGAGGFGGGAIQISVNGTLTATGTIDASGGAGQAATGPDGQAATSIDEDGGGGGGSGGGILLEAGTLDVGSATLRATGGGGAEGCDELNANGCLGVAGADGRDGGAGGDGVATATGGPGGSGGPAGSVGSAGSNGVSAGGGGGGGGAGGRIQTRTL